VWGTWSQRPPCSLPGISCLTKQTNSPALGIYLHFKG
jgi:hypothetical protein